jgi:acyl-CoA thioesterase-1
MKMMLPRRIAIAFLALAAVSCSVRNVGCGVPEPLKPQVNDADAAATTPGGAETGDPTTSGPRPISIVFLGDSLTAGLGLLSQQAFPALIEDKFADEGYHVEVVNAGVSGDTSAGGLRRLEQFLGARTRILVLALGANDALRGLSVTQTRENLSGIVRAALQKGIQVVVCGMEAPTNYGEDYRAAFREVYLKVGLEFGNKIVSVPFLLEGVAGNPTLNQTDGIHPNEAGARAIAELLYPRIRMVVDSIGGGGG